MGMPQRWSETALSIGANATSTNRVIGTLVQFTRRLMLARLAAVASAAGILAVLQLGNVTVYNFGSVSNAARYPNEKDDVIGRAWMATNGEPINLQFQNTTAGALTVSYFLDFLQQDR